jgi:hypothetical protein
VELERPRTVPALHEIWPGGTPPETMWQLQNDCPRCGLVHSLAGLIESSGPSHRDFRCPYTSKRPLISIFWNGNGWTWRMDPTWVVGLRRP